MIKNLDLNKRYAEETKLFVREPVESICKEIEENPSSKIVLGGGRGTGKSTILHHLENKNLGRESQFICMHFESAGWGQLAKDKEENELLYKMRYGIQFCYQLLQYIESYYGMSYEKYFMPLKNQVDEFRNRFWDYMKKQYYSEKPLPEMQNIACAILEQMKNAMSIQFISLGIDRFDWTNNRNPLAQIKLSNYFALFDKVVVTTDDKEVNPNHLLNSGYACVEANYGKNIDVVKEIIKRKVEYYNSNLKNSDKPFSIEMISEEMYQNLVQKSNGNLSVILQCLSETIDDYAWDNQFDIEESFNENCNKQLQKRKKLDAMGFLPQLYL